MVISVGSFLKLNYLQRLFSGMLLVVYCNQPLIAIYLNHDNIELFF